MTFTKIDIDTWDRKEYFLHYYHNVRCTYSVTANIDITEIYRSVKENNLRLYPTLIWWIANTVNHFEFLRFNHDADGNVGFYDVVNPSFTFMPPDSEKFHVLWCRYEADFHDFYDRCLEIMDTCDICRETALTFPLCRGLSSLLSISTYLLPVHICRQSLPPVS